MNDPGVAGKKLSKSGDNGIELRNKSYNKVLDAQIAWIRERNYGCQDIAAELLVRWQKKVEWHDREFGW